MEEKQQWFVMRDLHRGPANQYVYEQLAPNGFETYTPLVKSHKLVHGKAIIVERPYIRDLFVIHGLHSRIVSSMSPACRFQFRYRLGVSPASPLVVPDTAMEDFIRVNRESDSPEFISPESIPSDARNRKIRVLGGPLDGVEGMLKTVRGSKFKTLYVELPGIMAISTVSQFDYIQILED